MANAFKDVAKTEAWSGGAMLGTGWHDVKLALVTPGTSSGGYPQIEMEFEDRAGGSIRDWLVVIEKTMGKVKQLLIALGFSDEDIAKLGESFGDLEPQEMVTKLGEKITGKSLSIFIGEEVDRQGALNDDGTPKTRKRVQTYADKAPEGQITADTSGLGNGGPQKKDDIPW